MYMVSSVVSRNGADGDPYTLQANPTPGETTVSYFYEGARSLLDGHGFQGFTATQATNQDTGITSRMEYVTSDPNLAGRPNAKSTNWRTGVSLAKVHDLDLQPHIAAERLADALPLCNPDDYPRVRDQQWPWQRTDQNHDGQRHRRATAMATSRIPRPTTAEGLRKSPLGLYQ